MSESTPLPLDVPWRRAGFGASLQSVTDRNVVGSAPATVESSIEGLAPSVGIFSYVVPATSQDIPDSKAYPNSRIVLLKLASTLTGIKVVRVLSVRGIQRRTVDYLPCIGAVLRVTVS